MANTNNGQPKNRIKAAVFRYVLPVALPTTGVIASAIATASKGAVKGYWILGVIAATLGAALLAVLKDRNATNAREKAVAAKTQLAITITDAGQPIVTALGNVTSAGDLEVARSKVSLLINRVIAITQSQAGRQTATRCKTRSAFYEFDEDDNLKLVAHEGRPGGDAPRKDFVMGRSNHDTEVLRFSKGEAALLVEDLEGNPPPHFSDKAGRSYKSFVSVPVRAAGKGFGLLTVDSDTAHTLSKVDQGYLILLAGALASGLAHLRSIETQN